MTAEAVRTSCCSRTLRWSTGPWPSHLLWLDALFTVAVAYAFWTARPRIVVAPLVVVGMWTHLIVSARLIPSPRSTLEWGGVAVSLGFALLLASLTTSWFLRSR